MHFVIDANIAKEFFYETSRRTQILLFPHVFVAPKKLEEELNYLQSKLKNRYGVKKAQFLVLLKELQTKVRFEAVTDLEIEQAAKIIKRFEKEVRERRLDMGDVEYIALCCRYAKKEKAVFLTRDSPFLIQAPILESEYSIICMPNFPED